MPTPTNALEVDYTADVNDNLEFFAKVVNQLGSCQTSKRDLFMLTDWMAARMVRLGWLQELDKGNIPNFDNLTGTLKAPEFDPNRDYSLPWQSGMTGIATNPKLTGGKPDPSKPNAAYWKKLLRPGTPVGRLFYAASTFVCTPNSLSQEVGLALGAQAGEARIRAVIWMGLSNQHGHLVLACGNKSELATGYSTIYGDAVGGFAPIKDVPKTLVWELASWRNAQAVARGETPPIPEAIDRQILSRLSGELAQRAA